MVFARYHQGKLLRRAALMLLGGMALMGSLIGAPLGLYLIAYALRAAWKAMTPDKAAIIQHPRGLEVRTLWRTRTISFDHYRTLSTETVYGNVAGIPIPGPTLLVIHYDLGGAFGKRKLRMPLGYLTLNEGRVALLEEAIERFAMAHREAGALWHKVLEDRGPADDHGPPPRALAAPPPPRVKAAPRRDPLEGAPRPDLAGPVPAFGRKLQ